MIELYIEKLRGERSYRKLFFNRETGTYVVCDQHGPLYTIVEAASRTTSVRSVLREYHMSTTKPRESDIEPATFETTVAEYITATASRMNLEERLREAQRRSRRAETCLKKLSRRS